MAAVDAEVVGVLAVGVGDGVAVRVRVAVTVAVVEALGGDVACGVDDVRAGADVAVLVGGADVRAAWGQTVLKAMAGGWRRPPSCQTQPSVEPGFGSCVPAPSLA
jgi:hypothetical protein